MVDINPRKVSCRAPPPGWALPSPRMMNLEMKQHFLNRRTDGVLPFVEAAAATAAAATT